MSKLLLAVAASLAPVPPFATAKSVPLQSPLLIESVPPNVMVPDVLIVPPVNVIPFTLPEVATDVTVPVFVVKAVLLKALLPNSLVPTTPLPLIINEVASEP